MPQHKAQIKSVRQNQKRTERNRAFKSRARNAVKKLRLAISDSSKKDEVKTLFIKAESLLKKSVSKGLMKKGTASRLVSRLGTAINKAS